MGPQPRDARDGGGDAGKDEAEISGAFRESEEDQDRVGEDRSLSLGEARRGLQALEHALRESFGLLDLFRAIAPAADAETDEAVTFQDIQGAADARPGPKRFISQPFNLLWPMLFLTFFFLLPGAQVAMEELLPVLFWIPRIRALRLLGDGQDDRINRRRQLEITLRHNEPAAGFLARFCILERLALHRRGFFLG